MDAKELPANVCLTEYERLADDFLAAYNKADSDALQRIKVYYGFAGALATADLRQRVAQRLRRLRNLESQSAGFEQHDARDLVADSHGFPSWLAFTEYIKEINDPSSPIAQFESAVDAIVTGDAATLERLLQVHPELIRTRSAREHGSTLLHYVAANGVEDFRQKTPWNAVQIAQLLIKAGAEVDADQAYGSSTTLRVRYPGRVGSTTLGLVATSIHPARAGVQIALMETLLEAGAALGGIQGGWNFVNACLANGRPEAAQFLARRGARLNLESAAGVGDLDLVRSFFNEDRSLKSIATNEQMASGFMWACEYGHTDIVKFLLDLDHHDLHVGTNANGMTGLHWAMVGGHLDTIKLLLERKAPLEAENSYGGTVLGCLIWAVGNSDPVYRWPDPDADWAVIVQVLIDAGAKVYESDSDFPTGNDRVDELLLQYGMKA